MVITVLQMKYKKKSSKKRDYEIFDQVKFKTELNSELNENVSNCPNFEDKFIEVQNKHAPMKKKILRANNLPYMTKEKQSCKGLN